MSNAIEQVVRACKRRGCGHDRASHHRDSRGEGDCLCGNCPCKGFDGEPDTLPRGMRAVKAPEPFPLADD